jgi:geranylgeranyl pyrophosphate synthase
MERTLQDETCRADSVQEAVQNVFRDCLFHSPLGGDAEVFLRSIGLGKMLRARLAAAIGRAVGAGEDRILAVAASVEMTHAASLLHDDVIDGGELRRGRPSFWKRHGVQGAVLLGDLLLLQAIRLVQREGDPDLTALLIDCTGDVCMAEVEQELVLRGAAGSWDTCLSLARRKTGALFAYAAAGCLPASHAARHGLREAGYLIGTAYQLADDLLDDNGAPEGAGKSLGSDRRRGKITAASVARTAGVDPAAAIRSLIEDSKGCLADCRSMRKVWEEVLRSLLVPVMSRFADLA